VSSRRKGKLRGTEQQERSADKGEVGLQVDEGSNSLGGESKCGSGEKGALFSRKNAIVRRGMPSKKAKGSEMRRFCRTTQIISLEKGEIARGVGCDGKMALTSARKKLHDALKGRCIKEAQ